MNIDVPPWVTHEGQSIYSVDIDCKGRRAATAGSDAKVKIWSLSPMLQASAEQNEVDHPRLLATLSEHCSPVNTVRFAGDGQQLASCSDDQQAFVFQLISGQGKAVFGSNDKPSLENWKLKLRLRGHTNNVVDVEWSPDSSQLATCSLDNTIIIWSSSGNQVAILEGHTSYVKGVSWDPVGSYMASQSDDKSIIVWRCSDWSIMQRITSPFEGGYISVTFSLRLSWTRDGQYLVGTNSFMSPSHCACMLTRGEWDNALSLVGHKNAVTVVRLNPLLFKGRTEGAEPINCFALGSQDKRVTVWLSDGDRPLAVLSKAFDKSVADLAWSPDGHTLLAASTSGNVMVARFSKGALGQPVAPGEQRQYMERLYGDRPVARVILPESASQLGGGKQPAPSGQLRLPPAKRPCLGPAGPGQAAGGVSARLGVPSPNGTPVADAFPTLPRSTANGPPPALLPDVSPARLKASEAGVRAGAASQPAGASRPLPAPPGRRLPPQPVPATPATRPGASPSAGLASPGRSGGKGAWVSLQPPKAGSVLLVPADGGGDGPVRLDFANSQGTAHLTCFRGTAVLWRDRCQGTVVKATGNANFSAVALLEGGLQVYSAMGSRLLPSISLGAPALHLCADAAWKLLVVCGDFVRLWDVQQQRQITKASATPLLHSQVVSARLSQAGSPLVLLADGTAHLLHPGLREWLCVLDPALASPLFTASPPFATSSPAGEELACISAEAAPPGGRPQLSSLLAPDDPLARRRHLEALLAASLALESPQEYRRWLLTYTHCLADSGEEGALRELCQGLLGPLRWSGEQTWAPQVLGLEKRSLLREVLAELWQHRAQLRLVAELTESLEAALEPSQT